MKANRAYKLPVTSYKDEKHSVGNRVNNTVIRLYGESEHTYCSEHGVMLESVLYTWN